MFSVKFFRMKCPTHVSQGCAGVEAIAKDGHMGTGACFYKILKLKVVFGFFVLEKKVMETTHGQQNLK